MSDTTPNRDLHVVVGATGAVGTAVVERLLDSGRRVLGVARDVGGLAHFADAHPDRFVAVAADLGDDASIQVLRDALDAPVRLALFGPGLRVTGSALTIGPGDLAYAANLKVSGAARLLQAVEGNFADDARFVAIAGSLGLEPGPYDAAPGTANAALMNLMQQISRLLGPRGVSVHTIAPGPLDTPRLRSFAESRAEQAGITADEAFQNYVDHTSLGRLPTVADIAWLVEMLLSPHAAALHGGVLRADAGAIRHAF